ncbi:MAG: DUF2157 domain-containing protein [Desulfuromonadales bacterium]|nr:DUF2157 domain-containing protein [Desulfuromonadales bacterium]
MSLPQRTQLLRWASQGRLDSRSLPAALKLVRATPTPAHWYRFLDRLALWTGLIFMASGVIFFFAYNWQAMGRYAKFGLAELLLVVTVGACWKLGLDKASGKASLLAATLLLGALLALVGQTYQTGADTWELFATWALLALPWVLIGRFSGLLLFWIGLLNLSVVLYLQTFPGRFLWVGLIFGPEEHFRVLFLLNSTLLCLWELGARRIDWLQAHWSRRILATAGGVFATGLALFAIFEFNRGDLFNLLVYLAWVAAIFLYYRHKAFDLFVLAGTVLSLIVTITALLVRLLHSHAGSSLLIGLTVIGLATAGGLWLKKVAGEMPT